jgi:hypothetical protein
MQHEELENDILAWVNQAKRFIDLCGGASEKKTTTQPKRIKPFSTVVHEQQQQQQQTCTNTENTTTVEPDHVIYLPHFLVTVEDYNRIVALMNAPLLKSQTRGKKFRRAHDLTRTITEPIVIPSLPVDNNTCTQPLCVICQERIIRGTPRCKFSIVHAERPKPTNPDIMVDLCETHVSHALCYAVQYLTTREGGMEMVCHGTCLDTRGGCRQPKKIHAH